MQGLGFQEIAPTLGRTKTNTGRWVENTKALERTVLKELGKLHPFWKKDDLLLGNQ